MKPKRKSATQTTTVRSNKRTRSTTSVQVKRVVAPNESVRFIGEPVPDEEARFKWPHHYNYLNQTTSSSSNKTDIKQARCHYYQAEVDGILFSLNDDAFVMSEPGKKHYVCKILAIYEATDGEKCFNAQWYYRPGDTVIKQCEGLVRDSRIFISEVTDDNPLESLIRKATISPFKVAGEEKLKHRPYDFYCNMKYLLPCSSIINLTPDASINERSSPVDTNSDAKTVLDLYAGCGAMSTGLCLGANAAGVKLITQWAVDNNVYACRSLQHNHPETQVRHESAEDFLGLIKAWDKLRCSLSLEVNGADKELNNSDGLGDVVVSDTVASEVETVSSEEEFEVFEVEEIQSVCFGDPNHKGMRDLHFKIRWMGYGPADDTWEPLDGLSSCQDKLKEFVSRCCKSKILPLPGTVDVICGGPPCQGVSGFNRYRNETDPLKDPKNKQLLVFMDIMEFLEPRFVLMENVVDLLKFANGFLGQYALGRIVSMGYQTRMGLMAAGFYGLPQFRMRVFVWGARTTEQLPQFPLPTHVAVVRGYPPTEFEHNVVAFEEGHEAQLKEELHLGHAISDLPTVTNYETRDTMLYGPEAQNEFQRLIRLRKNEIPGSLNCNDDVPEHELYDHLPLRLNNDDFERVCQIPQLKGANFRDLPGLIVIDNKVQFDPDIPRQLVSSGNPLVPRYAMRFEKGSSSKPFGRLWWDETVPTVVARAEPHNQVILHPKQERVLTIRENARLQGIPDFYRLTGPVKERYKQVGNAVAVPVARALGHSLALAFKGLSGDGPVFTLPESYPHPTI